MSFIYTLRYSFDPRTNTKEQDERLYRFVKKAKIDDVAFFINGEELNHSHLTKAQTQVWLDAIKPIQKKLAELGVTTSLNPWTTIMHSDRGYHVNPEIGFRTFVDINGDQAQDMACPADPTWRKYITERYAQYASIHPRRLWMEDDFRHYNHTPLKLMCFCDYHMKIYQEKLGKKESRAEFVKNMLKPGKPTAERKIYLDQARKEMIKNEKMIADAVHKISPKTDMGQMTSFPDWHAIEGRDWNELFDAQGLNHPRVARPHLPAYNEVAPNIYARSFEEYSRITAAYLGDEAELYPELENSMWTPQVKSNRFIAFQIITSALIGARGIMLNLFDMMGNGINDHWHYDTMLAKIKPFATKLKENRLKMHNLKGIKVLVDQDSAYSIHTTKGQAPEEMLPHEKNWASLLASFGFATTILPIQSDMHLKGQTIAIAGQLLRNFTNEQITELLKNNTVFLDGESIQVILDRELDSLLHIHKAAWHPCKTGYQSFEQADGLTVQGVKNPRVTMNQHTGNYLKIDYDHDSDVKVWSWAYSSLDEKLGAFMTVIDKHIILMPMDQDPKHGWESQFSTYKQGIMQQIASSVAPIDYLDVDMSNVKLNVQSDGKVAWISNFSLDSYDKIKWHVSHLTSQKATLIRYHQNGVGVEEIDIDLDGKLATINEKLEPLETIQLIFK
ncbi:hypothetical protein [uncultured Lactobacillus sp.]|uniref:hypothetical protein n=1 Tax=uncultured Lactobacillus sp. TaxID=153152 RepID=UPI002611F9AF|nr:hypothetical protein [uncultured Lactobacillus sp.]